MSAMICRQVVMTGVVVLAVIGAAMFAAPAQAEPDAPAGQWKFSITPYFWLPNINGTLSGIETCALSGSG